jgi:hypothetical protein
MVVAGDELEVHEVNSRQKRRERHADRMSTKQLGEAADPPSPSEPAQEKPSLSALVSQAPTGARRDSSVWTVESKSLRKR